MANLAGVPDDLRLAGRMAGHGERGDAVTGESRRVVGNETRTLSAASTAQAFANHHANASGQRRYAVIGNCQIVMVARCIQAYVGGEWPLQERVSPEILEQWRQGAGDFERYFREHEKVWLQPWIWEVLADRYAHLQSQVVLFPSLAFMGFQPDLVPVLIKDRAIAFEDGPFHRCNSSLAFLAWKEGLSIDEAMVLFRQEVFEQLGFYAWWDLSMQLLLEEGHKAGLPLEDHVRRWLTRGNFMHCHVHPKLFAVADITRALLERLGEPLRGGDPIAHVADILGAGVSWPVYPDIATTIGISGDFNFKQPVALFAPDAPVNILGLRDMLEQSFAAFSSFDGELDNARLQTEPYLSFIRELRQRPRKPAETAKRHAATHPYEGLPAQRFWRSAVEKIPAGAMDPVVAARFRINEKTAVATAGSCFAQHIARRLSGAGFHVLKTEHAPAGSSAEQAQRRHFELFPARFGNIYTARQLLQLFERAYGEREAVDAAWLRSDGCYVDPFRPQIEPDGYATIEALEDDRRVHLAAVREMFETLDVFVFTLGLTEAWRSAIDGSVFPIAPGVAAGEMDAQRYEFVNFTLQQVDADLEAIIARLTRINPRARVILTVSPVPLAATYEDRHVLTASTYSKSVLRVAAEQLTARHAHVDYFPSYEIITGAYNRGAYFERDLRSVSARGVDHVMRTFFTHYVERSKTAASGASTGMDAEARQLMGVLCDEEMLAAAAP